MVSESLQCLADYLKKYTDTGIEMEAPAVFRVVAILEAAVEDAEELESRAIPVNFQQPDNLPENVIRLVKKRKFQNVKPDGAA